jgi:uncharacterized protein (DUF58 family)
VNRDLSTVAPPTRGASPTGEALSAGAPSADLLPPELLEGLGSLEIIARQIASGFIAGLHRSVFIGSGEDFSRHRAYQPGDEVRRIDWRLFARSDRLFVKQFQETSNLHAFILIDTSLSMAYGDTPDKLRYSAYLAAALSHLMLRAGDAVGLAVTGPSGARMLLPARNRRGHLHQILLELETLEPNSPGPLAQALDGMGRALRREGRVIVISDFLETDGLLEAVGRLRARGDEVVGFRIATPQELGQVSLKHARYYDPDHPRADVAAAPGTHEGFKQRVAAWYDILATDFQERGAELVPLTTADPLANALRAWVASR